MGRGKSSAKKMKTSSSQIRFGILIVSDRSFRGERPDQTGPMLANAVQAAGWQVTQTQIIPDEYDQIVKALNDWVEQGLNVVLTAGGTGFSPRDITPEATIKVVDRLAPGIPEHMRSVSVQKNPHAILSRSVAGMKNQTLIVNLPGSPKAAVENFQAIQKVIPHAVELLDNDPKSELGHTTDFSVTPDQDPPRGK